MTIAETLTQATRTLAASSESPRVDAEILLAQVLGVSRGAFYAKALENVSAGDAATFNQLISRRTLGEPIAYITGEQGFWSLDLRVTPEVLIPRPDTELLVEWALEWARITGISLRIADLGTGSGAIALALARELPQVTITAIDVSVAALNVARGNAERLAIGNVHWVESDFAQMLGAHREAEAAFDLIVSNPPYIAEGDAHLAALRHEPRLALTAGADGLDCLRAIIRHAPVALRSQSALLLEHGYDQAAAVRELLQQAGFVNVQSRRDLGGHERASGGMKP